MINIALLTIFSISCQNTRFENRPQIATQDSISIVHYAKGFAIEKLDDSGFVVTVFHPDMPGKTLFSCRLYHNSKKLRPEINQPMYIPFDSLAVFSATQLSGLRQLGLEDDVVGISESNYITDTLIKQRIANGQITELAYNGSFFTERILTLNPYAIFYSPYQLNQPHPLASTNLLMIPFLDFLETNPLGRAEWIKFTAVFFNRIDLADSIFNGIAREYNALKKSVKNTHFQPTVMSDKYFADQWYVPGGQSYIAALIADAGGYYLWKDNQQVASIPLDFESVLLKASKADYWRIVGAYDTDPSYAQIGNENPLYKQFDAFKKRQIIFCDSKKTGYFEKGPLEPHKQLADLIHVFHPELLKDYQPVYYKVIP